MLNRFATEINKNKKKEKQKKDYVAKYSIKIYRKKRIRTNNKQDKKIIQN